MDKLSAMKKGVCNLLDSLKGNIVQEIDLEVHADLDGIPTYDIRAKGVFIDDK